MQPTRDNIIVNRIQTERTTESGLILQSNNGEPDRAQVVALGPKVDEVQIGDTVLLNWNKAVKVQDETYVVPITEVIFIYD
jgi:co-chaperonin GroES (HSP10)